MYHYNYNAPELLTHNIDRARGRRFVTLDEVLAEAQALAVEKKDTVSVMFNDVDMRVAADSNLESIQWVYVQNLKQGELSVIGPYPVLPAKEEIERIEAADAAHEKMVDSYLRML